MCCSAWQTTGKTEFSNQLLSPLRLASEDVFLRLINSKCFPLLAVWYTVWITKLYRDSPSDKNYFGYKT